MPEFLIASGFSPQAASVLAGMLLGAAFGVLAQRSRFCLRRGLVGSEGERAEARVAWAAALAVAVAGTAILVAAGYLDFSKHRFHSGPLSLFAIIIGGMMFGIGMVLARGCASRLTVLAGTGNLRALTALAVFAISAHATLKGVLAPARVWLSSSSIDLGPWASLAKLPGGGLAWAAVAGIALAIFIVRSRGRPGTALTGGFIGLLVPLGWLVTGKLLADEFDPIPLESIAFTSSASESLFWLVAGTAVAPGFGVGLVAGVLIGSLTAALAAGEFRVEGFTQETPTGRYLAGSALMGIGGVLAGGCTVGAGLSGVSTLSVAALLALASIIAGALATKSLVERMGARLLPLPAE